MLHDDNRRTATILANTGKFNNINFIEFCKYAHYQIEELINYYYLVINDFDLNKIKTHIIKYNQKAIINEQAHNIGSINFLTKNIAFKKEFNFKNNSIVNNLTKVRNDLSHRATITKESVEKQDKLLEEYYYNKCDKLTYDKCIFLNIIDLKNNGDFLIFKRKEDWESVRNCIKEVNEIVLDKTKNIHF